jgi:hypothetical protein
VLSPHAVVRERALFMLAVDADRRRRAEGLPERERALRREDEEAILARVRQEMFRRPRNTKGELTDD